jgi:hypothetical protein
MGGRRGRFRMRRSCWWAGRSRVWNLADIPWPRPRVPRVNLDHGVDVIKTRATERAGLPKQDPRKQVYTEAQLRVIVEATAARGGHSGDVPRARR